MNKDRVKERIYEEFTEDEYQEIKESIKNLLIKGGES